MDIQDVIIRSENIAQKHPEWGQDQNELKSALDCHIDDFISKNPTMDVTDKIIEMIVRQTRAWIERNLPNLMEKVRGFFDYVLDNIGDWIMKGINYLTDLISDYF